MGCDIHIYIETKKDDKWNAQYEFDMNRSYGTFGFMANVRNYSCVPSLTTPNYDIQDMSELVKEFIDGRHSQAVLTLKQMLDFNYENTFEDRRCMRNNNGASICEPGDGEIVKFRDFLSPDYFSLLDQMIYIQKKLDLNIENVRIIFAFDN